jgi:hypothetical protein
MGQDEQLPFATDEAKGDVDGTGIRFVAKFDHSTIYTLCAGLIRPSGNTPIPAGHGLGVGDSVFGEL